MMRYNDIAESDYYKECLNKIEKCEKNRKICRHDIRHFLDVARIAYIIALEENIGIDKDIIYAAAMLHDIGRYQEYENGISHEKASADIAEKILKECGYCENDKEIITNAILAHRGEKKRDGLSEILYRADKFSRDCVRCEAKKECYWNEDKKNKEIVY